MITISKPSDKEGEFRLLCEEDSVEGEVDEASFFIDPLLSHATESCEPHSELASAWDVTTKGLRDANIDFYVGSTYTLRSSESLPFFNTLYANGYVSICRICHQPGGGGKGGQAGEALSSPCSCKGPLKFVHHSCLVKWLDVQTRNLGKLGLQCAKKQSLRICRYHLTFFSLQVEILNASYAFIR